MVSRRRIRVSFFTTDNPQGHSGIDRYTSDLLRELAKRDDIAVVPVTSARGAAWLSDRAPGIEEPIVTTATRGVLRSVEERYGLARKLTRARIDVVHGTKHILPRGAPCPTVLTVYDLFAFTRGRDYRWSKRLLLPVVYRQSMAQANRIITMTQSVRHQILARGLGKGDKIDVVPAAPSTDLTSAEARAQPTLSGRPFALCVGDRSPRKNVDLLVRIWPRVHRDTGLVLALVGPDRSRSERTRDEITALQLSGVVVAAAEVSDEILRWCYEQAKVVLVPSLEEGYGLPAIEAGHFGAPLVTSRDPALVEVSGHSASHVGAYDDEAWVRAISASVGDDSAPANSPPGQTWHEIAELTAGVYHRAASNGS